LYETENVRLLRRYFYEALDHGRAYYLYGAPGTQKTYVLQHLIAELNRSEIAKNGEGRRAYYVYVRQGIHRSEEHTSELQSLTNLVCRLLLEKKKNNTTIMFSDYPLGEDCHGCCTQAYR